MTATLHNPMTMPMEGQGPRPHRWTLDEYQRMIRTGMFDRLRLELVGGEILEMSPHGGPHALAITLGLESLQAALPKGFVVRVQLPLAIHAHSMPEPDLAVVRGKTRDYPSAPTTAELIVEIADTSLDFDLGAKASLYASAGIADYWVVDLNAKRLIVHRQPAPDAGAAFGHRYASLQTLDATGRVSPLANATAIIAVADLLP